MNDIRLELDKLDKIWKLIEVCRDLEKYTSIGSFSDRTEMVKIIKAVLDYIVPNWSKIEDKLDLDMKI